MFPDSKAMSITHFLACSSESTPDIFQRGHLYDNADLLSADNLRRTYLHFTTSRSNLGVLSYLIKRVSTEDVERKDIQGQMPFRYATESCRAAGAIHTLVCKGCNIYAVDDTGRTALHWAGRWYLFKTVEKVIAIVGGGTLLLSDTNGRMPLWEVCHKRAPFLANNLKT